MSTALSTSGATVAAGNKFLWAAVGALGASTLALGAVVLHQQSNTAQAEAPLEVVAVSAPAPVAPAPAIELVEKSTAAPEQTAAKPVVAAKSEQKLPVAPVKHAQVAAKNIANADGKVAAVKPSHPAAAPANGVQVAANEPVLATPAALPAPVRLPAKMVCTHCGVVEAVTPVQRESANPSGAGAVAGAVLGGLVGNQFGGGDGKALATIAGVLGGGWAGNTVEKRLKKDTVYLVDVRMEDGSLRSIEQATAASVGQHVTVEGNRITPANAPSAAERAPAVANSTT